jgi:hypothetical protein
MPPDTTPEVSRARGLLFVCLVVLALLTGACTIFALVVTAAQAWQEHAEKSWPEVTAHVDTCRFERNSTRGRHKLYIACRFTYEVGAEQNAISIYSTCFPAPEVAAYPPNQQKPFEDWLDAHPPGTPIALRYDPANHKKAVISADFMPRGGPHTQNNIKLLTFFALSFIVLLSLTQLTRPRKLFAA